MLADPFSVSFHAIVRHPPPASGRVLVYGAGALGLTSVAILKALYPGVEVGVVARFEAQRAMALQFGADAVFAHEPRLQLVEELAAWSGAVLHMPLDGLPVTHPGHIDVVYDSIAKAETLEVGVRVLAERGRLVYTGVATPERWESTPIYFKEITIAGSNAFGMEDFEGRRLHAIALYLELVRDGRLDITPDAHAPLRARGMVARPQGPGPPGPERRPQGRLHPQRSEGLALTRPCPRSLNFSKRASAARTQAGSGSIVRPTADQRVESSSDVSSPAARRAKYAAPSAAPSGTATVSTGRLVASATAAIHAVTREPPPLATMRVGLTPARSIMRRTTNPLAS